MEGLKSTREIIEYYYRWKKYCNTEYRGRTRHESDDVTSQSLIEFSPMNALFYQFDSDEELQYNGPPFECEYPDCGAVRRQSSHLETISFYWGLSHSHLPAGRVSMATYGFTVESELHIIIYYNSAGGWLGSR